MNLNSIHREIEELLRANPKNVAGRRKAIAALRKGKEKGLKLRLPGKRKAWFSTTQTNTTAAKSGAQVQVLGINAGEIQLDSAGRHYEFRPNKKLFPELSAVRWKWSNDAKDAASIRAFLKDCETHPQSDPANEREIQWQLAKALGPKKVDGALKGLAAVTWNGRFTEVGVSVTKDGKLGTGNIDLIVRRGETPGKRGFLVSEVKGPGETDVEAALQQALRYATALGIESNGFEVGDKNQKNLEFYHSVFDSNDKGAMKIGAVIVFEDTAEIRRKALKVLPKYWSERSSSQIDSLGVLLYKFDGKKAHTWTWLDGWDARETV